MRKKYRLPHAREAGISGSEQPAMLGFGVSIQRAGRHFCAVPKLRNAVQRSRINAAEIAIESHSTEKSICPIGGMSLRTGFRTGSQNCASKRLRGA